MKIELSLFKYSVYLNHDSKSFKEFLYSHDLKDDEIIEIATAFVGDLMDQIHQDAERQLKN
jgi:hypothetical protein